MEVDVQIPRRSVLALILAGAIRAERVQLTGSWSATANGRTLAGTWTAQPHEEADAAWGAWSLVDRSGRLLGSGSWTARKEKDRWRGLWNAEVTGGGAYSGSWTAQLSVSDSLPLFELFRAAVNEVVSGTWSADRGQSGAWSIRADQP